MSWLPFITPFDSLSNEAKTPLLKGEFVSMTIAPFNKFPFDKILQFSFNGKNGNAAVVYVGVLSSSMAVMIEITDLWSTAMYAYGAYNDEGALCLATSKSEYKLPLFTKIFINRQEIGIPHFLPEDGKRFLALQVSANSFDTDKEFYDIIGNVLKMGYQLIQEIDRANIKSHCKLDFATAIKALLHII